MENKIYNPWAGLSSYQDPETSEVRLKFCGRDNESYDVADLIDNNIFVTLYGKSGTGKTSLLNAGVFPRLREERYLPISIRLGMEARDVSFQKYLITKVEQIVNKDGIINDTDIVPLPENDQATEYLWSYFARKHFLNCDGQTVFPVIVLDQFEEVFRGRRKEAEALLCQIYYLMDESHALDDRTLQDGNTYSYDYNFRFVVAIREDDLFRLEDSIDNNYLQNMKRCRYRLRNLSEEGAREAILIPGEELFLGEDKDKIADTIISISRNKADQSISANILSLICNRIFDKCQREGLLYANLSLVETFVKGNPFEQFYNEATKGLSDREKAYIETHMVDSEGRRNSVPETDFLLHVKNGERLFEGESRILQRSSASSDGTSYRIELRHDSFCATLAALKERRERKKRIQKTTIKIVGTIAAIAITLFILSQFIKSGEAIDKATKYLWIEIAENAKKQGWDTSNVDSTNLDDIIRFRDRHVNGKIDVTDKASKVVTDKASQDDQNELSLDEWKAESEDTCMVKAKEMAVDYRIPNDMWTQEPCLVYLILTSKSISDEKEKQICFHLYNLMNQEQIDKLYDILYREKTKLAEIDRKYQKRKAEIAQKYGELNSKHASQESNQFQGLSASELNEFAYEAAIRKDWDLAIKSINKAIEMEPNEANYYDSKGEILFDKGEEEALLMWNKVMEIDPNFLKKHEGSTPFYEKLKKRGLIK